MHKLLSLTLLLLLMISCSRENKATSPDIRHDKDCVEVLYFHGAQRCATCNAIEALTHQVVDSQFAHEVESGALVFQVVDITTPEGEALADRYEVTWSSLFVNQWHDGAESRHNLTEFAFANARNRPEQFKAELIKQISQLIE